MSERGNGSRSAPPECSWCTGSTIPEQSGWLSGRSVRLQAQAAQLRAQLAGARLTALQMQLNPHFLFNTLHAISTLVERDPRGVRRMIARLSELLRYTLDGAAEQVVPLRQELHFIERYLEIMQVRFQGRLIVETEVERAVLDAQVPNLILQPLVENAVKHGVGELSAGGRLELVARRSGELLVLSVRDNGPGLSGLRQQPERGPGVGLRNTRERLEQLYGEHARLELEPAEGGGTIARIELPFSLAAATPEPAAGAVTEEAVV